MSLRELATTHPAIFRQRVERQRLLRSFRHFVNQHYPELEDGDPFIWGPHHTVICDTLERVYRGEIKQLIINLPPGFTKTMLVVIFFAAWCFAGSPRSRFLHVSASQTLINQNSEAVKAVMATELYQTHFPHELDKTADRRWQTSKGGMFQAVPLGGTITGLRAGRAPPPDKPNQFMGALLLDDLQKAQSADKKATRPVGAELRAANTTFHSTISNRIFPRSNPAPIIIIQQRLHVQDISGDLLTMEGGTKWHHLCLPVVIEEGWEYPAEWVNGIEIPHGLPPGPLWPWMMDEAAIENERRRSALIFNAQYMQRPIEGDGAIFTSDHFHAYKSLPDLQYRVIYADTAQKAKESSDYTVFQCWGRGKDNRCYLIDQLRLRVETPEMVKQAVLFYHKHQGLTSPQTGQLRGMKIEDKVSGTGLIQILQRAGITAIPIPRSTDKVSRAHDVVYHFASGNVLHPHPKNAPWVINWKNEMLAFPDGVYDDQCDPTFDAVAEMCGGPVSSFDVL